MLATKVRDDSESRRLPPILSKNTYLPPDDFVFGKPSFRHNPSPDNILGGAFSWRAHELSKRPLEYAPDYAKLNMLGVKNNIILPSVRNANSSCLVSPGIQEGP